MRRSRLPGFGPRAAIIAAVKRDQVLDSIHERASGGRARWFLGGTPACSVPQGITGHALVDRVMSKTAGPGFTLERVIATRRSTPSTPSTATEARTRSVVGSSRPLASLISPHRLFRMVYFRNGERVLVISACDACKRTTPAINRR
jgi:hypothetical protein